MAAPSKVQGIALIQVLLITAILSVLAMFLTTTAKEQVKVAQWADDKSAALIAIHNAEANLLFELLTHNKIQSNNNDTTSEQEINKRWNFFAHPFNITSQVNVKIQDQSALINAHFPDEKVLKKLILHVGHSLNETNVIFDNLLDWQDLDNIPRINGDESLNDIKSIRNGAFPDLHDSKFVQRISEKLHQSLLKNTTLNSKGFFNPMNSPKQLLTAITTPEIAEQIIELRVNNQLSNKQFSQLTGIVESDKILFYPSNLLSIEFEGRVGTSKVYKKIILELNPYADSFQTPINIFSTHG